MKKLRLAALLLGALLLAATPVGAQVPDTGDLLPGDLLPGDVLPGDALPGEDDGDEGADASPTTTATGAMFAGVSNAVALELSLAGTGLTIGSTDARVQSGPTVDGCADDQVACATAAGELLLGETAEAFSPGNDGPNTATAFELPIEDLLSLDIGVATAQTAATPAADADAAAATVEVNLNQTLAEAAPLQDTLQDVSDTLLGTIAESDPAGLATRLKETLDFVIDNLDDVPLATVEVGPSSSESSNVDGVTRAAAFAEGAKVVLVPTPAQELLDVGIDGLAIVEVGSAAVEVSSDATAAQAAADPAIVRVSLLDPTTLSYDVVDLVPGASECLLDGTPLRICISLAGSEVVEDGANAAASAQAVRIQALADPLPELILNLASVEAGVSAAPAPPPPPPPPPAGPPLPVTGFALLLPGLALIGVGGAGFLAVRRRRD